MKKMRRLFATLLVIAICMSVFVLPGHAITIYNDKKQETYWDTKLCKNVTKVSFGKALKSVSDSGWKNLDWKYKDGVKTNGSLTSIGTYPTRAGVILVTSSASIKGVVGHCAIVYSADQIIEAYTDPGSYPKVILSKNNWNTQSDIKKGSPAGSKQFVAVTVSNTTLTQDFGAAYWCYGKIGSPYDPVFPGIATDGKCFYCSELVWAGYKEATGVDLNTSDYTKQMIGPYEFIPEDRLPSGQSYWKTKMIYAQNWWGK